MLPLSEESAVAGDEQSQRQVDLLGTSRYRRSHALFLSSSGSRTYWSSSKCRIRTPLFSEQTSWDLSIVAGEGRSLL